MYHEVSMDFVKIFENLENTVCVCVCVYYIVIWKSSKSN